MHSGTISLPIRVKAYAVAHDEFETIREWLPGELASQSALERRRAPLELKGCDVVSHVFEARSTATVRPLLRCFKFAGRWAHG